MKMYAAALLCVVGCDVGTASSGSEQDYETFVRNRASIEFDCASAEITVTPIDHSTYEAEGCGYRVTYDCVAGSDGYGPDTCEREATLNPLDAGCK
jgi:hypothetical protein